MKRIAFFDLDHASTGLLDMCPSIFLSTLPKKSEQIEDMPQFRDETIYAVTLIPRERVHQRTAEQMMELPQPPGETVDAVTLVPRERVQHRSAEQMVELPQSPWSSDEDPPSKEVERKMRAQEALWAAKARRRRVLPHRWQKWH